jgi:RNA polymerase sigma-70 factor (ECF subfamily)
MHACASPMALSLPPPRSPTPLPRARDERVSVASSEPVSCERFMGATPTLRAIYDEHVDFVWRSLRRLGVSEADAPDATQEVFLVVHRRLAEFEGRAKLTTWLYGIAFRVASDRRKRAWDRRRSTDDAAVEAAIDPGRDAGAELERRQGLAIVERILDELPLEQRAVFTLFELDEQSGEAIADLLEIPLGTVYSRLRLAREAFARQAARLRASDERLVRPARMADRTAAPSIEEPARLPVAAGGRR